MRAAHWHCGFHGAQVISSAEASNYPSAKLMRRRSPPAPIETIGLWSKSLRCAGRLGVVVELEGDADQAGDRVGKFLGQFLGITAGSIGGWRRWRRLLRLEGEQWRR